MRKWHALVLLLAVASSCLMLRLASAQAPDQDVVYSRFRHFRIPFKAGPGANTLKQLQLFVSNDQGRSWQVSATAPPDQEHFRVICDHDGLYWFTVQTLDQTGRYFPATMAGAQASLKVLVDTVPPLVSIQPLPPRSSEVGVAWEVRDEHLDQVSPDALRLEYRAAGSASWVPVPAGPAASQYYWNPQTNAPLEVRLRVRDKAGNLGEATTTVGLGQHDGAAPFPQQHAGSADAGGPPPLPQGVPGLSERRLVNSKRVSLNYEIQGKGPSGVSTIELWFTQDGRSWNRYPLPKTGEQAGEHGPLVFEVGSEGVYGFTLVAKSGVGLGERPPQIGDRPQVWVEVDLTRPVVQLYGVVVGQGADKGKLTISWAARDRNLAPDPITLSYAQRADEKVWTPIASKLANSGRFVWSMPEPVPYQFYVKVEAADLAGNVGEAATPDVVKVDLSQPKVKILTVEPAGR